MENKSGKSEAIADVGHQLTYWNHDVSPSAAIDAFPKALDWLRISTVLSTKISSVDIDRAATTTTTENTTPQ